MSEHTPGPWYNELPLTGGSHRVITGGKNGIPQIAYIPKNSYGAMEAEAVANARLIAAAPELHDLLADILPVLEADLTVADCDQVRGEFEELIARTKAAIAKATGH